MTDERIQDLRDTIEDIIQEVVLLEAMTLRMEQHATRQPDLSSSAIHDTFRRVVCYLSQHAFDLQTLTSPET